MNANVKEANNLTQELFETSPSFFRGTSVVELDSYLELGRTGRPRDSLKYDFTAVTPDKEISDIYKEDVTIEYEGDSIRKLGEPVEYDMFFKKKGTNYESKKNGKMDAYYMDQAEVRLDNEVSLSELKIKTITIDSDDKELIKKYSKLGKVILASDEN